ncbi:MAG: 1-acyl-sn-glycerol-3-phosphate acyltransferase [Spirochaetes bacterium]|nr:1-acyl-sn-glycerol-3-phosphate acyltransferase [Spirochaetota bacterium]MBN2770038.1 1-acyl-sn-glycerol-3-phosphate acyltransferase [Spirochaetota bacterium]
MKFLYSLYRIIIYPILLLMTALISICVIIVSVFSEKAAYVLPIAHSRLLTFFIPIRLKIFGKKNLEKGQSYVFVINHNSALDIGAVYAGLKRDIRWVMKKELTDVPVFGTACRKLGNIPIDRKNPNKAVESINVAKQKIRDGVCLAFFPEGTRRDDVLLGPFKKGAFHFAIDIGIPVVPITLVGMEKIMPKTSRLFYPGKVKMFIHSPIESKEYTKQSVDDFSDKARLVIESTLKREYSDDYFKKVIND